MLTAVQLSTMWAQKRARTLVEFFAAGRAAGYEAFELSHQVRPEMLDGAVPGSARVPSVHAPCPNPATLRQLAEQSLLVSSPEEGARRSAVEMVLRSIDLAQAWGARVVVLHAGQVDEAVEAERALRESYRRGEGNTRAYRALRERVVELRAADAPAHLEAVKRSLSEILAYARPRGIRIGLEVRFHYEEIPSFEEMASLLEDHSSQELAYWHDAGHAQVLENLGFTRHLDWLEAYSSRMIGVHFHDVIGIRDHRLPGEGMIDFGRIASYLRAETLKVCEFDWPYSAEEIARGRRVLAENGCL